MYTMDIIYILIGITLGGVFAWIIVTLIHKGKTVSKSEFDALNIKLNSINTELGIEKEKSKGFSDSLMRKEAELQKSNDSKTNLNSDLASVIAKLDSANETIKTLGNDIFQLKIDLKTKTDEFNDANKKVAELTANNRSINEKLETQKYEIENLRKQFNIEFENIANKILDEKTKKFTDLNIDNLTTILKPLGDNIETFKKKVEEVYDKESKERFSLGKEVAKLVELNQKISEDANNLTNALKGSSKTQGDWGQMILENILEKSGLVKDREYFVQEYLKDKDGNYLKNEDGNKMQPDVIVSYPDNRKVVIDSKVSLSAYTRFTATNDTAEQKTAVDEHLKSIRKHIDALSNKNYQDFAPTLDFVMMFVPNEPAYFLAMQYDSDLWHYAYSKRIILISPTNLIAALKLIVDLWKREYQNRNAQEIADRGAVLYDKFVGFVDNLTDIGTNLEKTQKSYNAAFGQLKDGKGNLIGQAEKLKELGVRSKKNLSSSLLSEALTDEQDMTT